VIDDDPMTDHRKAALANAINAQQNVNQWFRESMEQVEVPGSLVLAASAVMAQAAQVFATLDLADATREQTAALEAIDVGRRLGR
jgi:hypothetical protein